MVPPAPPGASGALELSVVVPTCNRPRELRGLLAALNAQDLPRRCFEVLVCDDGSLEPAREACAGAGGDLDVTWLRQPRSGPAAARNAALARARGDTLVFLNDDALPGPGLLRGHLERQREARAGGRTLALLGPFALLPRHRRDTFCEWIETSTALFAQPKMRAGVRYAGLALCTGNASLPRAALDAVGGFDTGFPFAGGEDSELGLRLERALGLEVRFDPALECGHDHALTLDGFALRQRVIGWAAWRIQSAHGDVGLVSAEAWPMPEHALQRLVAEVAEHGPAVDALRRDLAQRCAREAELPPAARQVEAWREGFELIRDLEQARGLECAARGRLPCLELQPSAARVAS